MTITFDEWQPVTRPYEEGYWHEIVHRPSVGDCHAYRRGSQAFLLEGLDGFSSGPWARWITDAVLDDPPNAEMTCTMLHSAYRTMHDYYLWLGNSSERLAILRQAEQCIVTERCMDKAGIVRILREVGMPYCETCESFTGVYSLEQHQMAESHAYRLRAGWNPLDETTSMSLCRWLRQLFELDYDPIIGRWFSPPGKPKTPHLQATPLGAQFARDETVYDACRGDVAAAKVALALGLIYEGRNA